MLYHGELRLSPLALKASDDERDLDEPQPTVRRSRYIRPSVTPLHPAPHHRGRVSLWHIALTWLLSSVVTVVTLVLCLHFSSSARNLVFPSAANAADRADLLERQQLAFAPCPLAAAAAAGVDSSRAAAAASPAAAAAAAWPTNASASQLTSASLPTLFPSFPNGLPNPAMLTAESIVVLRRKVETEALIPAGSRLLILGLVNFGFLDFALNWLCSLRRLGIENFLLAAVDRESEDELRLLGYGRHVLPLSALFQDERLAACGGERTHQYRTPCFNLQTQMKSLLVLTALQAGYDAVLSDMDIVFLHHPLLFMPLSHLWEMQLEPHEWCTGFYFLQSHPWTVEMQRQVVEGIRLNPGLDDQELYNRWIGYHRTMQPDIVNAALWPLSRDLFPIGKQYGKEGAVLQHNNWVFNAVEKRRKQREIGLYLFNASATLQRKTDWLSRQPPLQPNSSQTQQQHSPHEPQHAPLLVCDACLLCDSQPPALPPLRHHWPGQLIVSNLTLYAGPSLNHP